MLATNRDARSYLAANKAHYEKGYFAPMVDHYVFRFHGRILRPDFQHLDGSRLIDFGCGQGAAVNFFIERGYDAVGVDISEFDISAAKERYPEHAGRFLTIDPDPAASAHFGFSANVGIVTAFQSLYFLNDGDMDVAIDRLHAAMKPGGVFFATMILPSGQYWEKSVPTSGGMRAVNFSSQRLTVENMSVNFTMDEAHMVQRFARFEPVHIGHYSANFRSDEGGTSHLTFCGVRR